MPRVTHLGSHAAGPFPFDGQSVTNLLFDPQKFIISRPLGRRASKNATQGPKASRKFLERWEKVCFLEEHHLTSSFPVPLQDTAAASGPPKGRRTKPWTEGGRAAKMAKRSNGQKPYTQTLHHEIGMHYIPISCCGARGQCR